jgi:nucleotide-binding universal stress UspA family protein
MATINKILVPFANSPSAIGALKTAISISKLLNSKLYIIHVVTSLSESNIIDQIRDICNAENVQFTFIERSGQIHKEIIKAEVELSIDLIVMGAYGVSGWQQLWVGSNAFKVVSTSHCPVLTLQGDVSSFVGFSKICINPVKLSIAYG